MNKNHVTISGHHIEVTPALESNIHSMASKLQNKFDYITNFHVILKIDSSTHPHLQQAEAELSLSGKKERIFAKASSFDMYESLHILKDKLDRQIIKHKEIIKKHGEHHQNNHDHHNQRNNYNN